MVAVTASTGIAAFNIEGTTLHSFAGIGIGKGPVDDLVNKIINRKASSHVWDRWMKTKTLIVDESKSVYCIVS